ncbi:MAG TPA: sigma-54 dependent transcriptional regulator, partial [Planctomycetaceae bacterium]|nr:sigma-54 dependent transcriptional regulator [Planctomycetaceae bacterium]
VTDLKMDDVDGLEILRKSKEELPDAEVIVVTGHASSNSALTAGQHGAYAYLLKPLDINELRAAVQKASTRVRLIRRNAELNRRLDEKFGFEGVIGSSPQMHKVIETLKFVAPTDSTVLIQGESGTGKELVARALHQNSPRKNKPFVPLNISALPSSILESELFGHEQGAFTGAIGRRIGKFEFANGGTLFLDEVGEMPMETQIKLLRVLEDRKVTRVGTNEEHEVNVRLVAATNADLKAMVERKTFRGDLYYRLTVVSIHLPPLRDRRSDIPLLMEHFRKDICARMHKEVVGFTKAARQALISYDWPGNIRQLRNTVERMIVLDSDSQLDVDDLPDDIAVLAHRDGETPGVPAIPGSDALIGRPLIDVERYYIHRALELTEGKREEAAQLLGIGERTLYRKIKEYGLKNY